MSHPASFQRREVIQRCSDGCPAVRVGNDGCAISHVIIATPGRDCTENRCTLRVCSRYFFSRSRFATGMRDMPEMAEMAQALSHRSNTCRTGKDKAKAFNNILGSQCVLSRAFASNHRTRKGSEERAKRVVALSRHLWRLFPPEFYPRTLTYIYLCSNITEYLTVNAFEKTRNTSL